MKDIANISALKDFILVQKCKKKGISQNAFFR